MTKDNLKVEKLRTTTLPPADPETVTTTLDAPVREDAQRTVEEVTRKTLGAEFKRFEWLTRGIVSVPKEELEAERGREAKRKRP
ncbi:MAG: hypothetical protein M3O98_04545 [Actinomycetota bacterium]|nr:hypothetical protein [Actinomycetota bacterium]